MDKNKQLEEMAKELSQVQNIGIVIIESQMDSRNSYQKQITNNTVAKHLYDKDYRKQSEVASAVIGDVWDFLESRNGVGYVSIGIVELKRRLYELKKKYGVTDTNVGSKDEEGK